MTGTGDVSRAIEEAALPPDNRELAKEPRNDIGNGRRLLARHGQDLFDVAEAGWHVWNGKRWELSAGSVAALGPRCCAWPT